MSASSPLVFRPSLAQRAISALLCVGSWVVGIRTVVLLLQYLPKLYWALKEAQTAGSPTFWLWMGMVTAISACLAGGVLLLLSLLALVIVEGCQVLVDELGISVEIAGLPGLLTRRIGAGRLVWKDIAEVGKRHFFFFIKGGASPGDPPQPTGGSSPVLRFLVVDEMERLVLLILERSPNLRFKE